jgi:hypothetical protein
MSLGFPATRARVLQCHAGGDKRFSPLYAWVTVAGQDASIQEHYELAKRWFDAPGPRHWRESWGKTPDYFAVGTRLFKGDRGPFFYFALWCRYLDGNPDLVTLARGYDGFSSGLAATAGEDPADCLVRYLHGERSSFRLP